MNIMVSYDETEEARESLLLAKKHAKIFRAKVFVVTSMKKVGDNEIKEMESRQSELDRVQSDLESEDIPCENHLLVRNLSPGEDLVLFAKEHEIEIIYIGRAKRSKVEKFILGSTCQHVLLNADCPVMAVK